MRPTDQARRLTPRSAKATYGAGSIGLGAIFAFQGFFLVFFYTDVAMLPLGAVTAGLAIGRLWDLANDPLVGWLSDNNKSQIGRRRVFVIGGAVPLMLTTVAALSIPVGLSGWSALAAIVVTYFLWDTAITTVHVPYYALGIEMFDEYDERTSIVAYGAIGALVGYLLAGIGIPIVADSMAGQAAGYRVVGLALGALAGVTAGVAGLVLREPQREQKAGPSMRSVIRSLRGNRPYLILMTALSAVRIALTTGSAALPFFVVRYLGQDEAEVGIYIAALLAAVVIAVPLWRHASVRWDKPQAYQASLLFTAAAFASVFFVDSSNTSGAIAAVFAIGLGTAAHWVLPWSMLPDAIDRATDQLPVGLPFGVYGTAEKVARTLALIAVPAVLGIAGYDAADDIAGASATLAIRVLAGPLPAAFLVAAAVTLRGFGLTRNT